MSDRGSFGDAVALYHLCTYLLLQLACGIEWQRGSTGENIFDRLHPAQVNWRVREGQHNRWHREVVRDTMLLAQLERLHKIKTLHHNLRTAASKKTAGQHNTVDMIERQEEQRHVSKVRTKRSRELEIVHSQVAMGQQRAFGETSRAGGIRQRQQVIRPNIRRCRAFRR